MQLLLDAEEVSRGLRRVAGELLERHHGTESMVLVGIRRGGVPVARQLAHWIEQLESRRVPLGSVDITLYRDDAATALPNPRIGPSQIPGSLEDKHVIVVDDVVFTGRTVRAALDALLDYGRPRRIELAALIDRGGRELPIQPDYLVRTAAVPPEHRVDVVEDVDGLRAVIQSMSAPSIAPNAP
ncbi:MAG: bifunctional pyr operon transcriptional regulator/uracil phosphoribosyltransferase PyrR [Polyangiaceae bacterium]|nr:bifunctional pyr operon transcriptional regulator/uracil phosphoribosyltransferase PyrR [Polyangiaceae bacterium]